MKTLQWSTLVAGVIVAVIAGIILEWLGKKASGAGNTSGDAAWSLTLSRSAVPNLNQTPEPPASAYQGGAPVVNYRAYQRVGTAVVEAQ